MILDQFKLDGRVALVTGANDGIGQAIALGLAEAGADIIAAHRSDISETKRLVAEAGRRFYSVQCDLSKMKSIQVIMDAVKDSFGKVDILVNCAGTIRRQKSLEFTEKNWDDVMNINLKVLFFLSQSVAKLMVEKQIRGKIINISSLLSFQGGILTPSYTASKFGVRGMTMTLANEWAKHGINVNAIAPGYIATKMTEQIRQDEVRSKTILERIPAGRWGTPEDFQGLAVLLASGASDYIQGYTIAIDGGWLGR